MLILINVLTILSIFGCTVFFVRAILNFWRTQVMMSCFYHLSPYIDQNARCADQSEFLSNFFILSSSATKQIAWSLIGYTVIIIVRYLIGALLYANV